jgi:hypothetical protein
LRYEACGGALFYLAHATRDAIEKQGIAYFADALQGRGYPEGSRRAFYYHYETWKETPVPHDWVSEGMWVGLHCMDLQKDLARQIVDAAKVPGSYFTTKDEGQLLVIPSLGLVVFTYFG